MSGAHFKIVVVGSGFGGSLIAMIAQRLGFSTALIERGRHPRFVIGESSTPLANLLLEDLAIEYDLPFVRPLCKWGVWQKQLPHIGCGLKRGFTFYAHELGQPFAPDTKRRRQLLVGASPNEEIADTHWYRPDFDHYLVTQAQQLGVTYWDETDLNAVTVESAGVRMTGTRRRTPTEITAEFVIDATGPRGFLWRTLGLPETNFDSMPATQGLFTHFHGVGPLAKSFSTNGAVPPYPPEQAAVHHIFPGGWIWVLRFKNGITSAGVAATDAIANRLEFHTGAAAWQRLLEQLPSLADSFREARPLSSFMHSPRLAFRCGTVIGARWALLPSAAGFVDPLLSTGFPLTLLGVRRLGEVLRSHWKRASFEPQLEQYARLTLEELDAAARLVGALYATMDRFDLFAHLSLLYFAAASFSETARRLGKPELADSFLLCRHPIFAKQFADLCGAARPSLSASQTERLIRQIRAAIEPFDVAGLTDGSRHPWYPALTVDMLRSSPKLHATDSEVMAMLGKCGLQTD